MTPLIPLLESPSQKQPQILQLYQNLELFSEGAPARNSLFVLGKGIDAAGSPRTHLLIVDPPADAPDRFQLEDDVAALYTGDGPHAAVPQVELIAGGVAHLRVGEHFLDVYVQQAGVIAYLPAVGVLLSGDYGSDALPPRIVPGSDGSDELETLRLLARLIKHENFQLCVPHVGSPVREKPAIMERLATDVAYLHGLRRVVPGLLQRGEPLETIERIAESLLPENRQSEEALAVHSANLSVLTGIAEEDSSRNPRGD
ncbi:hypothetical protein [Caldilinea sp.]|uniref:hypothetical protein n=1 Tax=Caldilinea sp. TaxID=2293560 RepID=UPI002C72909B|nr:hypothetical protein [Anaerolineales bacterium]HQY93725.1 hypothetical protein [Caldilinea sp.]HRA65983.1 hypothetical protein [Caldilinea sp.]